MPFIDDMHGHHLSLLQTLDGREVIYSPQGGSPRAITGMFQAYSELVDGDSVDVVANSPILSIRTRDIPELTTGDRFTIDGKEFELVVIRPDSEGITELMLEAV
ncbi:MAG: hypothetical protein ACK500_02580 [Flavobacteriales bacterium]